MEQEATKIKVLRGVASWLLQAVGVWCMAFVYLFAIGGPKALPIEAGLSSAFMVAYLIFKSGLALK